MHSVELRWLSVLTFLTLTLCWVDIFLNPLLRSLRTIFCKRNTRYYAGGQAIFWGGGGKEAFFSGVRGWGRPRRESLYVM